MLVHRGSATAVRGGRLVTKVRSGGRGGGTVAGGSTSPAPSVGGTSPAPTGDVTPPAPSVDANSPGLYVDGSSLGGQCSDARTAAEVSLQAPWCSLAAAATRAPAGSTIFVRRGSYTVLVAPQLRALDFRGYGAERPELAGLDVGGQGFSFRGFKFTGTLGLTNFDGATIADSEIAITPAGLSTPNAVSLTPPGSNFTFTGNYVHDGNLAILTRQPGAVSPFTNFTITGNRFVHMGGVVMHINYGNHWVVRGNEFADNGRFANIDPYVHPDAIHIVGADDDLLFDSNFVHSTTGGRGFLFEPGGASQTRVVVQNNVIVGTTTDFALRVTSGTPGMKIVNNTFALGSPVQGTGLQLGSSQSTTTPNLVVENNILNHFEVDSGPFPVTFARADYNMVGVREADTDANGRARRRRSGAVRGVERSDLERAARARQPGHRRRRSNRGPAARRRQPHARGCARHRRLRIPRLGPSARLNVGERVRCASVSALMAAQHDWLQVSLDQNSRRGLAEAVEASSAPAGDERVRLLRMLRSRRDELLFDRAQGELVLATLNGGQLSALQARLEAFLGTR